LAALEKAVQEDFENNSPRITEDEINFSLFVEEMGLQFGGAWIDFAKRMDGAWLTMKTPNDEMSYKELLKRDEWKIGVLSGRQPLGQDSPFDLLLQEYRAFPSLNLILQAWLKDNNYTVQVIETDSDDYRICLQLKKTPQQPYSDDALAQRLMQRNKNSPLGNTRYLLHCEGTFNKLHLKPEKHINALELSGIYDKKPPFILLPFYFHPPSSTDAGPTITVTPEKLDALCKWAQPNLVEKLSLQEIRTEYLALIEYIDNEIMRPSKYSNEWKTARGLA
jgi:hypothetical protein